MSVFSPVQWSMSAVQLVSTTTSQLATLNSIQAAFVASTYWEVETSGLSSLSYKYIVVRPKVALNSIYKDYRIFFCERVNFATNRTITDAATGFNTTTAVMAYFCPDGGAKTFTPANIETGDIWPSTNYKNGTITQWQTVQVACTAVWMYEADGVCWLVSRQAGTSHSLLALGNVFTLAKNTYVDFGSTSTATEIGCAAFYTARTIASAALTSSTLWSNSLPKSQAFWWKPSGVATRTFQLVSGGVTNPAGAASTSSSLTIYDAVSSTAVFVPMTLFTNAVTVGGMGVRGVYWAGFFKTRTTIQTGGSTIGYTWYPDDTAQTAIGIAFMNS